MHPNCVQFPRKLILRSNLQAQRFVIKGIIPRQLSFETSEQIKPNTFKKMSKSLTKCSPNLRNPPMKQVVKNYNLMKTTRALVVKPEEAYTFIKKIGLHFTRLEQFFISCEGNSFAPMQIKSKIRPIRALKTFSHDHELCKDFMACARYATVLHVKKSSISFSELKRFTHLETLHLIFKAKYRTFSEDDRKFISELAKVINKGVPELNRIIIEHEIDPENNSYIPLQLNRLLNRNIKIDFKADLVDLSNYRNPNNSVEKTFSELNLLAIQNMDLNYAGIMKPIKRVNRWNYVPICLRKELYIRLLKAIQTSDMNKIKMEPVVHTSHLNNELKNLLNEAIQPESKLQLKNFTLVYGLDVINEDDLHTMFDLYNDNIGTYEIIVTSTGNLTHDQFDHIENHFYQVYTKIHDFSSRFKLSVTVRDYKNLLSLIQVMLPIVKLPNLDCLSLKVIDALSKPQIRGMTKLINKSISGCSIRKLEVSVYYDEVPVAQDTYDMVNSILKKNHRLKKMTLLHRNTDDYEDAFEEAFKMLRRERLLIDLKYGVDKEKRSMYEQL